VSLRIPSLFLIFFFVSFFSPYKSLPSSDYSIGDVKEFWVQDTWKAYNNIDDDNDGLVDFTEGDYDEAIYKISSKTVNITQHGVFFVDKQLDIPHYTSKIAVLASYFESIYSKLESSLRVFPDINNDARVIIIITDIRDESYYYSGHGSSILGFFWPVHSTPVSPSGIRAYSHYSEIVYLDIQSVSPDPLLGSEVLAHELQHLLQFSTHPDQDLWLDEGLSVFSERLCGFDSQINDYQQAYFFDPFRSLIYFDQSAAAYGFSSLFVQYLYERFGLDSLRGIYNADGIGLNAVFETLQGKYSLAQLFINFSLALFLQSEVNPWFDIDTKYGPSSPVSISSYPYFLDWLTPSWSFYTLSFTDLPSSSIIKVVFDSSTPYDSLGYNASIHLTLVEFNDTSIKLQSWSMDSFTCDNVFLMTFDSSYTVRLLFIHSLAGLFGSPIAQLTNSSFLVTFLLLLLVSMPPVSVIIVTLFINLPIIMPF